MPRTHSNTYDFDRRTPPTAKKTVRTVDVRVTGHPLDPQSAGHAVVVGIWHHQFFGKGFALVFGDGIEEFASAVL